VVIGLLSRMSSTPQARPGTAALLVAAATTGALVTFGWRDGDLTKAFRHAGRMLLRDRIVPGAAIPATATLIGLLHHLTVACCWGALLLLLARPFRGPRYVGAVVALAVTFSLLNLWLIPPILSVGFAVVTTVARTAPLALAIAVALLVTPWASGVQDGPTEP
jgi:hypothetical protein